MTTEPSTKHRSETVRLHRQGIFPNSRKVAADLIDENPVLCFCPTKLSDRARLFIDSFPGQVAYAVKANPDETVLRLLAKSGIATFDVASIAEMETVTRTCPGSKIHYHNPVKSRGEIATAWHTFGCRRYAADSIEEISKIRHTIGSTAGTEIAIRFRLPSRGSSVHDFTSKFGADEYQASELISYSVLHGFKPVLTFHPGSQCTDPHAWKRHIEAAGRIAGRAQTRLTRLNVGGGFPARYSASCGPALSTYFEHIRSSVSSVFGDHPPILECEPGRSIAAPAFSLLTTVKLVRGWSDDLFINDGIYGGLLEVAQAPDLLPFYRILRKDRIVDSKKCRAFTVYGPTCDPLDVLPTKLDLPVDIQESDIIEFAGVGAYGTAMATRFNGYGLVSQVTVADSFSE